MNGNVSLLLVTFKRPKLLLEMLASVSKQTVLPDEVFVIDNNSSDNTKDLVLAFAEKHRDSLKITYHNTGANLGGAGGFEFGSQLAYNAGYEWIWLADDDVELDPTCLENLLKYKDKAAILQPLRVNMDGSCAEISGITYEVNSITCLNPKRLTVMDVQQTNWETVALTTIPFEGPLIHRSVFEKIGFPDPRFFIFYDDLDFALRARQAGFTILCVRNAVMKRKIPFVQGRDLEPWKLYFKYRNFFYVQRTYGKRVVANIRVYLVFFLAFGHMLATGRIKSLSILQDAFIHALRSDFSANNVYKPS